MIPAMTREPVQSLWIGRRLTAMEQTAIRSFLASGHPYHLYCYEHVEGVPAGTIVEDGNDILPAASIFTYAEGFAQGSPAAFSNAFRYRLLLDRGGWWVDTDVVCLRPFEFGADRLWATERTDPPGELTVSTSVIKAPPGDELMAWAWKACSAIDTAKVTFGQIGPRMLQAGVDALNLHAFMRPHTFFSPVPFYDWAKMLDPRHEFTLGREVYGIHLWNQMWAAHQVDKDDSFPPECLYERLKRRFQDQRA